MDKQLAILELVNWSIWGIIKKKKKTAITLHLKFWAVTSFIFMNPKIAQTHIVIKSWSWKELILGGKKLLKYG